MSLIDGGRLTNNIAKWLKPNPTIEELQVVDINDIDILATIMEIDVFEKYCGYDPIIDIVKE